MILILKKKKKRDIVYNLYNGYNILYNIIYISMNI